MRRKKWRKGRKERRGEALNGKEGTSERGMKRKKEKTTVKNLVRMIREGAKERRRSES